MTGDVDEDRWFSAVKARLRFKGDTTSWTMRCPICNQAMFACRRAHRITFAGPEPACIQVQCDHCGLGGEIE